MFSVCDICDAVQFLGIPVRYTQTNCFQGEFTMGRVCTVEFSEKQPGKSHIHYAEQIPINTIPVLSGPNTDGALIGGLIANYLNRPIFVNGNIRDVEEINSTCAYQGICGFGNSMYTSVKQVGSPMWIKTKFGEFQISNDDLIFMDRHGAVFLNQSHYQQVVEYVSRRLKIEEKVAQNLQLGMPLYLALKERNKIKPKL